MSTVSPKGDGNQRNASPPSHPTAQCRSAVTVEDSLSAIRQSTSVFTTAAIHIGQGRISNQLRTTRSTASRIPIVYEVLPPRMP